MNILDEYVLKLPNNQNILDIFKGEWSSKMPNQSGLITQPGSAGLFEDPRILWAEEVFGSFANCNILELGPLEGGHTYMFHQRNAKQITSIEANTRAFLKCLCIKEIFGLSNAKFKLGDFISYLENQPNENHTDEKYDIVFASGVLYHMMDPIRLLDLISQVTNKLFLWTHFYDEKTLSENKALSHKFEPIESLKYNNFSYECSRQSYKESLEWSGFCGGPEKYSIWLTRDTLFNALKHFGFTKIHIQFDDYNHPNGPSIAICAEK